MAGLRSSISEWERGHLFVFESVNKLSLLSQLDLDAEQEEEKEKVELEHAEELSLLLTFIFEYGTHRSSINNFFRPISRDVNDVVVVVSTKELFFSSSKFLESCL